jgi:sugar lactone lactonase YvrE
LPGSVDATEGINARFNVINGITTDGVCLYVTDSNNTIRRIKLVAPYPVTTLAGSPGASGSADGRQDAARFNLPNRITTDGPNLYVTDFNNGTIRKIALGTGDVTTIAGKARVAGDVGAHVDSNTSGDIARFYQPNGIVTDGANLYVTDSYDHTIRKIVLSTGTFSGPVSTITGNASGLAGSFKDGNKTVAAFNKPIGIATDGINLFIADNQNHKIRKIQ